MIELENQDGAAIAAKWWRELTSEGPSAHGTRRAALARLRRAATPLDVMQEPEALRLIALFPPHERDRAAILAGVLAFVREDANQPVARAIGRTTPDDDRSAMMAESRFRRLLQANHRELMDAMRRLVRLTRGKANVYNLSFSVLHWGDRVKKRWIFEYYNVWRPQTEPPQVAPNASPTS